ncbi:Mov34/MPN/PAD-1 family protein [Paenibacillus xerothermodurans]|uniref:JAB1/MPN/MOV34 metalloenzyme domain-containing protein n=1 Tax=Paenibacillus xerothermodurans TaxID=1977292 RepID=A0A2W1NNC4_PAEXE|nr:Mov34/MPN/PAD-1 family protein [Paenibacillus xerothermodurans]PZE20955.1 hypothetical protein CBW46_009705 [Paenibacillus xerothermodurans]
MITAIVVTKTIREEITRYCTQKKPHEACGFLFGHRIGSSLFVDEFMPVPNVAKDPARNFAMHPDHILLALHRPLEDHRLLAGTLHSHPAAPAAPSAQDLQTEWHKLPSHWIVSLLSESACDIRAYRYERQNDSKGTTRHVLIPISTAEK